MQRGTGDNLGVLHEIRFIEGQSRWADRVRFLRTLYPAVAFSEAREIAEHPGQQVIAAGLSPRIANDLVEAWNTKIPCESVPTTLHDEPGLGAYPVGLYSQSPSVDASTVRQLCAIRAICHSEATSPAQVRGEPCLRLALETRRGARATMSLKPSIGVRVRQVEPDRSRTSLVVTPLTAAVSERLFFDLAERFHGWTFRLPEAEITPPDATGGDTVFWEFLSPFGCRVSHWHTEGEFLLEMLSERPPHEWAHSFRD